MSELRVAGTFLGVLNMIVLPVMAVLIVDSRCLYYLLIGDFQTSETTINVPFVIIVLKETAL